MDNTYIYNMGYGISTMGVAVVLGREICATINHHFKCIFVWFTFFKLSKAIRSVKSLCIYLLIHHKDKSNKFIIACTIATVGWLTPR